MKKKKNALLQRAAIAAAACCTGLLTVSAAENILSVYRPEYVKIEDSMTTSSDEPGKFSFFGRWGSSEAIGDCSGNSEHYTNNTIFSANEEVGYSIKFTGTSISIYGNKAPLLGKSEVFIDGQPVGEFSAENSARITQQFLFKSGKLSNSEHTLRVVNKKEGGTGQGMHVDYVLVRQEKGADTQASDLTVEDNVTASAAGEENKIYYFGTWAAGSSNDCSGGNEHYSNNILSTDDNEQVGYSFTFTGTKVSVYGNKSPALSSCQVYIDEQPAGTYSASNDTRATKQLLYSKEGLTNGKHTLKVVNLKQSGSMKAIQLDYIVVHKEASSLSAAEVSPQSLSLTVGSSERISVSGADGALLWEAEDPAVISVDGGNVKGLKAGTTNVILTVEDTGVTYSIPVTVAGGAN